MEAILNKELDKEIFRLNKEEWDNRFKIGETK
jgi:hypothetical protein